MSKYYIHALNNVALNTSISPFLGGRAALSVSEPWAILHSGSPGAIQPTVVVTYDDRGFTSPKGTVPGGIDGLPYFHGALIRAGKVVQLLMQTQTLFIVTESNTAPNFTFSIPAVCSTLAVSYLTTSGAVAAANTPNVTARFGLYWGSVPYPYPALPGGPMVQPAYIYFAGRVDVNFPALRSGANFLISELLALGGSLTPIYK